MHVLDIGSDKNDSDYEVWIKKFNQYHPVLKDETRAVFKALDVKFVPTTVILDGHGNVHYNKVTSVWTDKEEQTIRATIDWLLQKP